jgi:RimJ/RimL family protein N-acetyltransferase
MQTSRLPYLTAYPKTVGLRDGTQVELRPLLAEDGGRLLDFFQRIPEHERYYLKENVTSPEVIQTWTRNIDLSRVIPIIAVLGDKIIADATLHRSRAVARCHIGELRIVVDPQYRELGLGRRLIRELLDIAAELDLQKATFQLVDHWERRAIAAAASEGFREVAALKEWVHDFWGNYRDLVIMELPMKGYRVASWF